MHSVGSPQHHRRTYPWRLRGCWVRRDREYRYREEDRQERSGTSSRVRALHVLGRQPCSSQGKADVAQRRVHQASLRRSLVLEDLGLQVYSPTGSPQEAV